MGDDYLDDLLREMREEAVAEDEVIDEGLKKAGVDGNNLEVGAGS